jgi:hypothetical protein
MQKKLFVYEKNKKVRFDMAKMWPYIPAHAWEQIIFNYKCKFELQKLRESGTSLVLDSRRRISSLP